MDVICMDLQKAFNKIPHTRLLSNLSHMELDGNNYNELKFFIK